ncbi:hypothetical protein [Notoacmeibacter sp. MSK16QG-6]|uniref:hypothetical protein n=1 Tax=Notoacmeibacter sp. MSK16QG-6 TaxID=2957982 RepID=UPI00209F41EA|nr:hypothetical protein [Notoacmeibacter sp. MSK16QG-6]MCP1199715.1 hypothetical protein [Notoacmeibacter sp. MSK16QG-6]
MKNLLISGVSALAVLGLAACSDSGTDEVTTQSTVEETQPVAPTDDTMQASPQQPDNMAQPDGSQSGEATVPSDLTLQPEEGESADGMDGTTTEPAN